MKYKTKTKQVPDKPERHCQLEFARMGITHVRDAVP
jgi:hypothetical protein